MKRALCFFGLALGVFLVAHCDDDQHPPAASQLATLSCTARVERCEGGVTLNNTCARYGAAQALVEPGRGGDFFSGGCVVNEKCDDVPTCDAIAHRLCQEPQCRIVAGSTAISQCAKDTCGGIGGGGVGGGGGGSPQPPPGPGDFNDPTAPYRIMSFSFTTSTIETNPPTRTVFIGTDKGEPAAIDVSFLLFTATQGPDTLIGFDLNPKPPSAIVPPQPLVSTPNTFSLADSPLLLGNVVVADQTGLSLYYQNNGTIKRTKVSQCGNSVGLDTDENFAASSTAVALTAPSPKLCFARLSDQTADAISLDGDPVDLSVNSQDVWVVASTGDGTGKISRFANPGSTELGSHEIVGDPIAIGGATLVGSTLPGAVVSLVKTDVGGEFQLYLGGNVNAEPRKLSFSGFPLASPKAMKVFAIDNTEHAWVALQANGKNLVALYNLATGDRVAALDVDLDALEPVALTVGILGSPPDSQDNLPSTGTAFLHVLAK